MEQGPARKTISERKVRAEGSAGQKKRRHTERENSKRKTISLNT